MKLARVAAYLTCGLLVVLAGGAFAGERGLEPILVGGNIDLDSGVTTNVGGVSAACNSRDNEYRVVWFDSRIAGQNDVYAQRVSSAGGLLGENVAIVVGPESQTDTAVAYDPMNNQYVITWRYQGGGPGSPGFNHTYGALVSATGGMIGRDVDISNGGLEATLAYNSTDHEYFLEARNFAGGGPAGIRGQRIAPDGQPIGPGVTIASAGAPAPAGQVAYDTNANQYLATWRDQTAEDLKGRIINADGTFATGPFVISSMFPESGLAASVAFDAINDRYLVVFSEFCCGGVYGQFVSGGGALEGDTFTIFESTSRLSPFVAYDPVNWVYLVAWYDNDAGTVTVQLLAGGGGLLAEPVVISGANGSAPRVAANSVEGGFLVAWVDRGNWPERADVLAQIIGVADPCPGDLNGDGVRDFTDFGIFSNAWLSCVGDPNYNPDADLDGSGCVDFTDFNIFSNVYLVPCP